MTSSTNGTTYYQKNKDHLLEKQKEYEKNKYHNDDVHQLLKRYQSRADNYFAGINPVRKYDAEELLGCSKEFFKLCVDYNLSINSIKVYHLAHVRPLATYEQSQILEAFHWTNVKTLSPELNLKQKDNRNEEDERNHA